MRNLFLVIVIAASSLVGCSAGSGEQKQSPSDLSRIAGWKGRSVNSADAFRFVIMSDRTGWAQDGKWEQAVDEVNLLRPDFVMCIGDLTKGYGEDAGQIAADWDFFDRINKGLNAPFFYAPGNHDVLGLETRKAYTARHGVDGKTWYSFDYRDCHFAIWDTTLLTGQTDDKALQAAHWAWLEKDLAAAKSARHVFIFAHHPMFRWPEVWQRVRKNLDPARTTVFSGHTHSQLFDKVDGVNYHTLGRTASILDSEDRSIGNFQMFAHVTVDSGKPAVSLIPLGQVLPHDYVTSETKKAVFDALRDLHLTAVSPSDTQTVLGLANTAGYPLNLTIRWHGDGRAFEGSLPANETVTVEPGKSLSRVMKVAKGQAQNAGRVGVDIDYTMEIKGRLYSGKRSRVLPVVRELAARKVAAVTIDGKAGDWADVPRLRQADGAYELAVAYDQTHLHVLMVVKDDKIATEGAETWVRDGVEVFWDPRSPQKQAGGKFDAECRQVMIPVPPEGKPLAIVPNPKEAAESLKQVVAAYARTDDGYIVEMSIPFGAVAKDFAPAAGQTLRMNFTCNDKDADAAPTYHSFSGPPESSRNTLHYAVVRF